MTREKKYELRKFLNCPRRTKGHLERSTSAEKFAVGKKISVKIIVRTRKNQNTLFQVNPFIGEDP